jgi:glycosyltransferase involved in cell wall biosynthesis
VNVLFVTGWYPTREFAYGGVFVREHAKAVREADHRVVVLHLAGAVAEAGGPLWTMKAELNPYLSEGIEAYHVFHRRLPIRGTAYGLYLASAIGAYRRLRETGFHPDVIHAHVYGAGVPAAAIGTRNTIPVVLTEHFSGFPLRTLSRVEVRKARYAYKRVDRALPVSRYLQEAIRSYEIDVPFEVVPNAVDTSLFFPPDMERPDGTGTLRLLFVGNLSREKDLPTLLRALARLDQRSHSWLLDVIGDGPERADYEMTAAALDLRGRVNFHGSQPKPTVAQMMRGADLLVLPSRVETFGAVVAEALASGLPVVSTNVGGVPELVDESGGTLVPPDDPVALADAIEHTVENLDLFDRHRIAVAARARFSLGVVGERLTEIYESVLAKSRYPACDRSRTPIV